LIIWSTYLDLSGVLIDEHGLAAPAQKLTNEHPSWGPGPFTWAVASNGNGFMVVWQQNVGVRDNRYVTELRAIPVGATGFVSQSDRTLIAGEVTWNPQVTWDGTKYVVTYTFNPVPPYAPSMTDRSATDIHELALTTSANVVAPPVQLASRGTESEAFSSAASNGASTLIAWERFLRTDAAQIEAVFSTSASATATSLTIPVSVTAQQNLAGVALGGDVLFAWEEILGEEQKRTIFLQRLRGGRPVDGRGIALAPSPLHQAFPALSKSWIAWTERDLQPYAGNAGVFMNRLRGDASVDDAPPLRLGAAERGSRVVVADASSVTLAVWVSPSRQIVAARIRRDGVLLDVAAPLAVTTGLPSNRNPVIASDGDNFLVVWEEERGCLWDPCVPAASLRAAVVTSSGAVQPSLTLGEFGVSNASAIWNGTEYVVFWNQPYAQNPPRGFVACRIGRGGSLLGAVTGIREDALANNVVWNGREYVVAITRSVAFGAPLAAARLDRDFHLIESMPISTAFTGNTPVVIVPNGESSSWIAYQATNGDSISSAKRRSVR
jgi:hypothetical protein